jgi:hypothetical protein
LKPERKRFLSDRLLLGFPFLEGGGHQDRRNLIRKAYKTVDDLLAVDKPAFAEAMERGGDESLADLHDGLCRYLRNL